MVLDVMANPRGTTDFVWDDALSGDAQQRSTLQRLCEQRNRALRRLFLRRVHVHHRVSKLVLSTFHGCWADCPRHAVDEAKKILERHEKAVRETIR